jgi:hypothetical protein
MPSSFARAMSPNMTVACFAEIAPRLNSSVRMSDSFSEMVKLGQVATSAQVAFGTESK